MPDERTERVLAAAGELGADWAVLTSYDAVAYGAGHVAPVEAGPSPFNGGPTTAFVSREGEISVLANELERAAGESSRAARVRTYESLGYSERAPLHEKYATTARQLLEELEVGGKVAIQADSLPQALAKVLSDRGAELVGFDRQLAIHRSIKTVPEIEALERCAELTAVGQEACHAHAAPGQSELDLFHLIRAAMEDSAGERLPVTGDLVSGTARTAAIGGWPEARRIESGDPIICDLAPRLEGYWGDSCTTIAVGDPGGGLERLYEVAYRALQHALATLGPETTAADFDRGVRDVILASGFENPIHIGHGIGTSVHEWPRLVPTEPATLRPGMVLMVEPGAYHPDLGGVRLEQMFLVTATGCRSLSPFWVSAALPVVGP